MKRKSQWDEMFQKANACQTVEDFKNLYDELFGEESTYDSAVHKVSALALAGGHIGAHTEGITGFQAGYVKFDFIRQWDRVGKEVGLQVINYDDLCYPQYVDDFPLKSIGLDMWKCVQDACRRKLNALDTYDIIKRDKDGDYVNYNHACWGVRQYWCDVCNGIIPDGLIVEDNGTVVESIAPVCVERPAHTLKDMEEIKTDHTYKI